MSNLNNKLHIPTSHSIDKLDILNTLEVSKYLKKFKFTASQAEAISNILKKNQDAMISHKDVEGRLATKLDIADVKSEIQDVRNEVHDIRNEIAELKVSTIKWQVGTMLILASLFISLIKF